MSSNGRPSINKRNREQARREKNQEKTERRAQRAVEKSQRVIDPSLGDPDIAGQVHGPQPPLFDD